MTGVREGERDVPVGVLLLHGFTGSPLSVRPVAEALVTAGFVVETPLLPGHGTSPDELEGATFTDWTSAAERAYCALARRCRSVGVFGISMGGALAATLALSHPEIIGVALVNPLLEPVVPEFIALLSDALAAGSTMIPSIGSDIAWPDHPPTGGIDATPVRPLLSLVEGVELLASDLPAIGAPVLLFSSRNDHVVPTSTGGYLEAMLTCPLERVMLDRSFHVATLDYEGDLIARRTVEFMERLSL